MEDLQHEFGTSILYITHDLGVIAETSDEVAVMYAGQIVEQAPTGELFAAPRHPYTLGLMRSVPRLEWAQAREPLQPIPGVVPDPGHFPRGCRFHPRCPFAAEPCLNEQVLEQAGEQHTVRCVRWREIAEGNAECGMRNSE